jgi:hypothetical protein
MEHMRRPHLGHQRLRLARLEQVHGVPVDTFGQLDHGSATHGMHGAASAKHTIKASVANKPAATCDQDNYLAGFGAQTDHLHPDVQSLPLPAENNQTLV